MNYSKNIFLIIICKYILLCNLSLAQESYIIKKKISKDKSTISIESEKKNKSTDIKKEESIKKDNNVIKNKDKANKNIEEKIDKRKDNSLTFKDGRLRIIYKPNQIKLRQEEVIKIIDISSNLNKQNVLTIKSYASKKANQGSSEARRLSLSRALEVRSLFIENEFPVTNILVKALGSEKNNEGFTDIIIIEAN